MAPAVVAVEGHPVSGDVRGWEEERKYRGMVAIVEIGSWRNDGVEI
jgi:hypothetical protein